MNKQQEKHDLEAAGAPQKTAEIIANKPAIDTAQAKPAQTEDKRAHVREEHTNHFTSRADAKGQ